MQANAARLAYRYCRHQLRSPSAREEGDFSLPEALNGALLAPKLTESGECRLDMTKRRKAYRLLDRLPVMAR